MCMVVIYRPDCLIAIQLSCELDMASSVRDMSSLSWVPSMDSREYTISTWSIYTGKLLLISQVSHYFEYRG